jgi:hypothetical protein
MATPSRTCSALGCELETPVSLRVQGLCLDHYIDEAFQKLDLATDQSRYGEGFDQNNFEWLLEQVDHIVEALGEEAIVLDPVKHSKLLELLLGIANLNEYVRHQTIVAGAFADGVPKQHVS